MTHGGRLEEFEILGQMPRDRAGIPDDPILSHGDDGFYHRAKELCCEGLCVCLPGLGLTACVAAAGNILRLRILNSDWGLDRRVGIVPL